MGAVPATDLTVRRLTAEDHEQWLPLWHGYQLFYEAAIPPEVTRETWRRFGDPGEPLRAFGAFDEDGTLLGIAHCVVHASTWSTSPSWYLNDLFTVEAARGQGVGRALIEHVRREAGAAGAGKVHWLTHETNTVARRLYDQVADRPGFIQYVAPPWSEPLSGR